MQVSQDVLQVLSAADISGNALKLTGALDRNLYAKTNKVLEAAGGKWNTKAKAHIFAGDAQDRIEQVILTGSIEILKDDFEYFPTPPAVVSFLMELADVKIGMLCLEPSAGRAAIADAVKENGGEVRTVELNAANAEYLRSSGYTVTQADFLTVEPVQEYDRVVMNPPFSKQQDIKHVLHALKFLKPGGLLVAVMASSVSFRENKLTTDFRSLVAANGGSIDSLPEGSFKASGTMVNAVVVKIPKKS
ncbi:methyltransferase [Pararheinheimera phage vB_PsoM_KLER1-1]|nr:methyltransferase [Pararheinheimera phage vB_PsoM_KLER1-1]